MKNVLFTTTALVALAGAASAEVAFSGELTAGYNDVIEGGLFWEANLNLSASVDMGDNVTATLSVDVTEWADGADGVGSNATVEIAYTGNPFSASLKMGDLGDEGASEYFYADRDGMALDVENHDGNSDARALVEFGNFGVAVGCHVAANECAGMNVGLGATFGSIELGVGYDDGANGQAERLGVSADAAFGALSVGVSYLSASSHGYGHDEFDANDADDTIVGGGGAGIDFTYAEDTYAVAIGYDVSDAISVGAYYASNGYSGDAYGASASYTAGALSLSAYYDHEVSSSWAGMDGMDLDGDGSYTGFQWGTDTVDSYGLDVAYAVNDQITANAGINMLSESDNRAAVADKGDTTLWYVGVDYAVNDNITATVSYAEGDEISGPEYKDGISAFITASF